MENLFEASSFAKERAPTAHAGKGLAGV